MQARKNMDADEFFFVLESISTVDLSATTMAIIDTKTCLDSYLVVLISSAAK